MQISAATEGKKSNIDWNDAPVLGGNSTAEGSKFLYGSFKKTNWYVPTEEKEEFLTLSGEDNESPSKDYLFYKRKQAIADISDALGNELLYKSNPIVFFEDVLDKINNAEKELQDKDADFFFLDILTKAELSILRFVHESPESAHRVKKVLAYFFKSIESHNKVLFKHEEELTRRLFENDILPALDMPERTDAE